MSQGVTGITRFDNELSILYKLARQLDQPVRLIIMSTLLNPGQNLTPSTTREMIERFSFYSLQQLIFDFTNQGFNLLQISESLPNVESLDIAMIYYGIKSQTIPADVMLKTINSFLLVKSGDEYKNFEELNLKYAEWHNRNEIEKANDSKILDDLLNLHSLLEQYDSYPMSPINIHHIQMTSNPVLEISSNSDSSEGNRTVRHPSVEDGIDIFNYSLASEYVPYIQYNSSYLDENGRERRYYKVYQGETEEKAPDFSSIILTRSDTELTDTIYMTVWGEESSKRATKGSYIEVEYNLEDNILDVKIPIIGEQPQDLVLRRIEGSIPVKLENVRQTGVDGEFMIYGIEINEESFLDMIMNDPVMNSYLYLDESATSYPEKERMSIHYKSALSGLETKLRGSKTKIKSSSRVTIYQMYLENNSEVEILDSNMNSTKVLYGKGTPYIYLTITKSKSIEAATNFVYVFNKLLSYYMNSSSSSGLTNRNEIENEYLDWISELSLTTLRSTPPKKAKRGIISEGPSQDIADSGIGGDTGVESGVGGDMGGTENLGGTETIAFGGGSDKPSDIEYAGESEGLSEAGSEAGLEAGSEGLGVGLVGTGTKGKIKGVAGIKGPKLAALIKAAPEIFVDNYAAFCQTGSKQPVIVAKIGDPDKDSKIEEWKNKTFTIKGKGVEHRQVVPFPKDNPKLFLGCDDPNPYPGIKFNDKLKNSDVYPYLPCCYPVDQTTKPNYLEYYSNGERDDDRKEGRKTKLGKSRHTIVSKIAGESQRGEIPSAIRNLLLEYYPEFKAPVRYGVIRSLNSFIHCVLLAKNDEEYILYKDDAEGRENYVSNVRNDILTKINLNTMKQELYDFTEDSIRSMILDPTRFFDPYLFYRSMEEMYDVNIYVLSQGKLNDLDRIEIPRNKFFHARTPRNRKTILVYKHSGDKKNFLSYPQYELISNYDHQKGSYEFLYPEYVGSSFHEALIKINRVITWSVDSSSSLPSPFSPSPLSVSPLSVSVNGEKGIVARENIYSLVDFMSVFKGQSRAQILDKVGKLRGYVVMNGKDEITFTVPPSQPENLPVIQRGPVPDYSVVLRAMGNVRPSALTKIDGRVNGLWYKIMDLTYGVFCPVSSYNSKDLLSEGIPEGIPGPLSGTGGSIIKRIKLLHRTRNVLLQILIWLYLLFQNDPWKDTDDSITMDKFINENFFVDVNRSDIKDSSSMYDLSEIPRILPYFETFKEGMSYINEIAPSLFRSTVKGENKIYLYSSKLANGVFYFLKEYIKITPPQNRVIPNQILGLFDEADDFIPRAYTALFTSENDMNQWLKTVKKGLAGNVILTKLALQDNLKDEPYFYASPDDKIYLVQNVSGGEKNRAHAVCVEWIKTKINLGWNAESSPSLGSHVIFGISNSGNLLLLENNTKENDSIFPTILMYDVGQYAALLPLL